MDAYSDPTMTLIGNKADLVEGRNLIWECAKGLADICDICYIETCAKISKELRKY